MERRELEDAVKDLKCWVSSRLNQSGDDPLAVPAPSFEDAVPGPSVEPQAGQVG